MDTVNFCGYSKRSPNDSIAHDKIRRPIKTIHGERVT